MLYALYLPAQASQAEATRRNVLLHGVAKRQRSKLEPCLAAYGNVINVPTESPRSRLGTRPALIHQLSRPAHSGGRTWPPLAHLRSTRKAAD